MTDLKSITSIKVDKASLRYLTSIKGYFEYKFGRKISFNGMIAFFCLIMDMYIKTEEGKLNLKDDKELEKFFAERIKFFGIDFSKEIEEEAIMDEVKAWGLLRKVKGR